MNAREKDRWLAGAIAASVMVLAGAAWAAIPSDALLERLKPQGRVNDFASVLSADQRASLDGLVQGLEQKTGAQLAVVTLDSLEGGQIDDFAVRLFKRWGIGQKDRNNGLLLLVALKDRKARIEVGYGLEPILPDALAGRVLNEKLFPAFRRGHYGEGLIAATRRIAEIVERGEPAPASHSSSGFQSSDDLNKISTVLFLSLFVGIGLFMVGMGLGSRVFFPVLWGSFFGGMPLFFALMGGGLLARAFLGSVAVAMSVLGLAMGHRHPQALRSAGRRSSPGGWSWGGSGGSGWSSGGGFSSGGGGFGGGCSGGGGASGGW